MYLSGVRLQNYQAYKDTGELDFAPGFNLLIGTNNSGKSAFLESLAYPLQDKRHQPGEWPRGAELPPPYIDLEVRVSGQEFFDKIAFQNQGAQFPLSADDPQDPNQAADSVRGRSEIRIRLRRRLGNTIESVRNPSTGEFQAGSSAYRVLGLQGQFGNVEITGTGGSRSDNLIHVAHQWLQKNFFLFRAERFAFSKTRSQNTVTLEANANNLAAVLDTLFGEYKAEFDRIVGFMKAVFDTVGDITLRTNPANQDMTEIVVWPTTESGMRGGRGFSLADCGTGVAQVLALLTGVSTIDSGIFVIDELNAFLHPAAAKALVRILSTYYGHHQYIISSHSPEVLAWHGFSSVHAVRREGYESYVESVDLKDLGVVRNLAVSLGISASDFFSAENVIWVEGPTEEAVFSFIAEAMRGALPASTKFLSVASTGDFNRKRDKQLVWEIYNRLSSANSPLLHSVRFSFDAEGLSETDKDDLIRASEGRATFIPRRNIEAYFIEPQSISELLTELDRDSGGISQEQITGQIATLAEASDCSAYWNGDVRNPAWLEKVDGARMLQDLFAGLTDHRVEYDKTTHGLVFQGPGEGLLDDLPQHVSALIPE